MTNKKAIQGMYDRAYRKMARVGKAVRRQKAKRPTDYVDPRLSMWWNVNDRWYVKALDHAAAMADCLIPYRERRHRKGFTIIEMLYLLAIIVILVIMCMQPVMESRTYNNLTGAHTTWWDALWLELRVQDQPKQHE